MRLVTFTGKDGPRLGAMVDDRILDLSVAATQSGAADFPRTMQDLIEGGAIALATARAIVAAAPADTAVPMTTLLAPLPRPTRFRDCCLFLEHMEVAVAKIARAATPPTNDDQALGILEKNRLDPEFYRQVIYYNADHLHIYGHEADIHWPVQPGWADYELEWACVVGKTGSDIARSDARDYIFGFTILNDWSARDLQIPFMKANLGPGEGKDFANSFGPCIVTRDELADPYDLTMIARVNGEEWSRGSTRSMHHRFEDAIVQFSRGRTLYAGEIIGSGTVLGGCGLELDKKLSHHDVVELEVEGIGVLRNRVLFPG